MKMCVVVNSPGLNGSAGLPGLRSCLTQGPVEALGGRLFLIIQLSAQHNRQRYTIATTNTKQFVFSLASPAACRSANVVLVTWVFTAKQSHGRGKEASVILSPQVCYRYSQRLLQHG